MQRTDANLGHRLISWSIVVSHPSAQNTEGWGTLSQGSVKFVRGFVVTRAWTLASTLVTRAWTLEVCVCAVSSCVDEASGAT